MLLLFCLNSNHFRSISVLLIETRKERIGNMNMADKDMKALMFFSVENNGSRDYNNNIAIERRMAPLWEQTVRE